MQEIGVNKTTFYMLARECEEVLAYLYNRRNSILLPTKSINLFKPLMILRFFKYCVNIKYI